MQINTKIKTGALAPAAGFRSRYLCLALALMTPLCAATINFDNLPTTSTTDVQLSNQYSSSGVLFTNIYASQRFTFNIIPPSPPNFATPFAVDLNPGFIAFVDPANSSINAAVDTVSFTLVGLTATIAHPGNFSGATVEALDLSGNVIAGQTVIIPATSTTTADQILTFTGGVHELEFIHADGTAGALPIDNLVFGTLTDAPEPSSLALLGAGAGLLWLGRLRRRRMSYRACSRQEPGRGSTPNSDETGRRCRRRTSERPWRSVDVFFGKHACCWFFSVLALVLFFTPTRASGDVLSVPFNIPDSLFPPPGAAPWGTLTLTLNADKSISVDASVVAGLDIGEFTFNTTSSSIAISGQPTNWFLANFPSGACAGNPAYGCFDGWVTTYQLSGVTPNPVSDLSFKVTTPSGFSSVNQLVGLNNSGSIPVDFEASLVSPSSGIFANAYALLAPIPEPSTLLLLGGGLLCFVAFRGFARL